MIKKSRMKKRICWKKARDEAFWTILAILGLVWGSCWVLKIVPINFETNAVAGIIATIIAYFGPCGFFLTLASVIEFNNVRLDMSYFGK